MKEALAVPPSAAAGAASADDGCSTGKAADERNHGYCRTGPGKITTVHSLLMLISLGLATTMLCLSHDASQRIFSLVMCCIALVLLLLWLSVCYRSYRNYRPPGKQAVMNRSRSHSSQQQATGLTNDAAGKLEDIHDV